MKKINLKEYELIIGGTKPSSTACFFGGAAAILSAGNPMTWGTTVALSPLLVACWNS